MRRTIHLCALNAPQLTCLACGEKAQRGERVPLPNRLPALCYNQRSWETTYLNHPAYRRCVDAPDHRDRAFSRPPYPTPTLPGFFWAEWRIVEEGTFPDWPDLEEETMDTPGLEVRVVQVWECDRDDGEGTHLVVNVPGVERSQGLDCFVWRSGRLEVER